MSEIAKAEETWLERAQSVTIAETNGQPGRADATLRQPETIARILSLLQQGASYKAAAQANGLSYATFKRWRETDDTLNQLCKEAIAMAYADCEVGIKTDSNWKSKVSWLAARKHVFADPDWTSQQNQGSSGITVNITLRQDDTPSLVDVTPKPPVLEQDKE